MESKRQDDMDATLVESFDCRRWTKRAESKRLEWNQVVMDGRNSMLKKKAIKSRRLDWNQIVNDDNDSMLNQVFKRR